jgi:hypothetical protein
MGILGGHRWTLFGGAQAVIVVYEAHELSVPATRTLASDLESSVATTYLRPLH